RYSGAPSLRIADGKKSRLGPIGVVSAVTVAIDRYRHTLHREIPQPVVAPLRGRQDPAQLFVRYRLEPLRNEREPQVHFTQNQQRPGQHAVRILGPILEPLDDQQEPAEEKDVSEKRRGGRVETEAILVGGQHLHNLLEALIDGPAFVTALACTPEEEPAEK